MCKMTPQEALNDIFWEATHDEQKFGVIQLQSRKQIVLNSILTPENEKNIRDDEISKFCGYILDMAKTQHLSREEIVRRLQSYVRATM